MFGRYGTTFIETEALLAVAEGEEMTAIDLLRQMSPGELGRLNRHALRLARLAKDVQAEKEMEVAEKLPPGPWAGEVVR